MRCADVIRELSAPTDGRDAEALARHVAACPACASQAEAIRRFDDVWKATHPAEPPAETWRQVWSGVQNALAAGPTVLPLAATPRRRWVVPALTAALVAQAVAASLAIGWLLRHPGGTAWVAVAAAPAPAPGPVPQVTVFELEPGQTLVLELDERGERSSASPVSWTPPSSAPSMATTRSTRRIPSHRRPTCWCST